MAKKCKSEKEKKDERKRLSDVDVEDGLCEVRSRVHAVMLAVEGSGGQSDDIKNALAWIIHDAYDAIEKLRDNFEVERQLRIAEGRL